MRALAELEVGPGQRMRWRAEPPVVVRRTGPARVHLVQAAGGPLGGDDLALRLLLAPGASLTVETAAATVAQPGRPGSGPARWSVAACLGAGARLCWWPEPTVVCDGADLRTDLRMDLAEDAAAVAREEVQLGRHGQRGGRYHGSLAATYAGRPVLRHATVLDGADPALRGPGGTGGARLVTTVVGLGAVDLPILEGTGEEAGTRWACQPLAGPGWLLLGVGDELTKAREAARVAVQVRRAGSSVAR